MLDPEELDQWLGVMVSGRVPRSYIPMVRIIEDALTLHEVNDGLNFIVERQQHEIYLLNLENSHLRERLGEI